MAILCLVCGCFCFGRGEFCFGRGVHLCYVNLFPAFFPIVSPFLCSLSLFFQPPDDYTSLFMNLYLAFFLFYPTILSLSCPPLVYIIYPEADICILFHTSILFSFKFLRLYLPKHIHLSDNQPPKTKKCSATTVTKHFYFLIIFVAPLFIFRRRLFSRTLFRKRVFLFQSILHRRTHNNLRSKR